MNLLLKLKSIQIARLSTAEKLIVVFLFLLPLFGTNVYSDVITPNISIRFAILLMLFISLSKFKYLRLNLLEIIIAVFGLISFMSVFYSVEPFTSLSFFLDIMSGIIFLLLCIRLINSKEILIYINKVFVFSAGLLGFMYILKYLLINVDILSIGFYNDRNAISSFLIAIFPLSVFFCVTSSQYFSRILWGIIVVSIGNAILLSYTKSVLLIAFFLFIAMVIIFYNKGKREWLATLTGLLLLISITHITLLSINYYNILPSEGHRIFKESALAISLNTSLNVRVTTWENSFKLISNNLLLGTGAGTFPIIYKYYLNLYENPPLHAYNLFLTITAELGLIGLILFLPMTYLILRKAYTLIKISTVDNRQSIIEPWFPFFITAGLVSFLLHHMVQYYFWVPAFQILFFFMVTNILILEKQVGEVKSTLAQNYSKIYHKISPVISGIAGFLLFIYGVASPVLGEWHFKKSKEYAASGKFEDAIKANKTAIVFSCLKPGYHYHIALLNKILWDITRSNTFASESLSAITATTKLSKDAFYYHNSGMIKWELGFHSEGVKDFYTAVRLYPKKIEYYYSLSDALLFQGNIHEALENLIKAKTLIEEAYVFDFRNLEIYFRMASAYERMDNKTEAIRYFNRTHNLIRILNIDEERLSQTEKKRYRIIKDIISSKISLF